MVGRSSAEDAHDRVAETPKLLFQLGELVAPLRILIGAPSIGNTGGRELAMGRLAAALQEAGHSVALLAEEFNLDGVVSGANCISVERFEGGEFGPTANRALARARHEVAVVATSSERVIRNVARYSPVILSTQELSGICPDGAKHWRRLDRVCPVDAGWKCAIIRPTAGCSFFKREAQVWRVRDQRRFSESLFDCKVYVWSPSHDVALRFIEEGFPAERIAVVPNLGMRASVRALSEAAALITPEMRGQYISLNRISPPKGSLRLRRIAAGLPSPLHVLSAGAPTFTRSAPNLISHNFVNQRAVAGLLSWARALVFPSVWPEPGGIAAIDAMLFGTPTVAFDVGAATEWEAATLVDVRNTSEFVEALASIPPVVNSRDPIATNRALTSYWSAAATVAELRAKELRGNKGWPPPGRVSSACLSEALAHR